MAGPKVHSDVNLPRDASGSGMQALAQSTIANNTVTSVSQAHALPSGAKLVDVNVSTDTWYLFGNSSVSVSASTGHFMATGAGRTYDVGDATHIAVIRSSADGRVSVEKLI